jgi:integrase
MSKALTAITVDKLKAKTSRYEVPDGQQRGLLLAVFPSGKKSFIVRYRFGKKKRKLTLGQVSLAAARKAAAAALFDVHEGRDPAAAKMAAKAKEAGAAADTVQAICERYLSREGSKLRTVAARQNALKRLVYPAIGAVPINELRRSRIVALLDKIQDKCGDRTADLALAYLRRVLAWHASRVDDFNSPIVRGMGRYDTKARARSRVLSDDEIRAIWTATEPDGDISRPAHAFARFLLLTGARRDEARLLTWSEIDGDKWHLPASRNKAKFDLTRPLSAAAQAVIAGLPRIDGAAFVFTADGRRPLSAAAPKIDIDKRSGVEGWTFHDLRRTARTLMSRAGISADIAERSLGHVISGVRGIYDRHEYHPEMQRAFDALAALIDRIAHPVADNVTTMRKRHAQADA